MTDIYSQLPLVPESLQMFLRPIVKTDERVAISAQNFMLRPVDLGQEYCHTKWGMPHNSYHRFGSNGCIISYRGAVVGIHWVLLGDSKLQVLDRYKMVQVTMAPQILLFDMLGTSILEETDDQIDDAVAVDAALEDLSVILWKWYVQ